MARMPPIVELRQYLLHPGQRDKLIALFDREFVESQEEVGIDVIGQFRDLDRPDHFVWLRGFNNMLARRAALQMFYGGPVWAAHRDAANATMVDSDDVLLLKPVASYATREADQGLIVVTVHALAELQDARIVEGALVRCGGELIASFVTEASENNFPRLPVREGENVAVCIARLPDDAQLPRGLPGEMQVMRLKPTQRSLLR